MLHLPAVCKVKTTGEGSAVRARLLHLPAVCKVKTTQILCSSQAQSLHLPAVCKVKTTAEITNERTSVASACCLQGKNNTLINRCF